MYINRAFVEKLDDAIQFKLSAAMEKDEVKSAQAEFEALAAQLGVDPADLLALQQKKQNAAMSPNQKQY